MVNHGKYHGILWNTMVYFHKGSMASNVKEPFISAACSADSCFNLRDCTT